MCDALRFEKSGCVFPDVRGCKVVATHDNLGVRISVSVIVALGTLLPKCKAWNEVEKQVRDIS